MQFFVVAFSTFLFVCLAEASQNGDSTLFESLSDEAPSVDSDIFADVGWQDMEGPTLNYDAVTVLPDFDAGFALAGTCGGDNDDLLPNKLRSRDDGVCLKKDPTQDRLELPNISPNGPLPSIEHWEDPRLGSSTFANEYKCQLPYPYNVCCKGDLGELLDLGPPPIWVLIEECYLSMPFER